MEEEKEAPIRLINFTINTPSDSEEENKEQQDIQQQPENNQLKIGTVNIRSYNKNRAAIELFILKGKWDLLFINETWLQKPTKLPTDRYEIIDTLTK